MHIAATPETEKDEYHLITSKVDHYNNMFFNVITVFSYYKIFSHYYDIQTYHVTTVDV